MDTRARSADLARAGARLGHLSPRLAFRRLVIQGLQPAEAANLIALESGLAPLGYGWAIAEIERLLFLRYLVETHRLSRES